MLGRIRWRGVGLLAGLLAVALPGGPRAVGQDKESPIISFVKPRLKDPAKPFTLVVSIQVKKGAGEKLEAAFAKAVQATRKEKGNLTYHLNRDASDPTRYQVYERWKSLADLKAHLKTPHIKALLAELGTLIEGAPQPSVLIPAGK